MPTTQRRLRRRKLREPDEFETLFGDIRDFVTSRWRELLLSAGLVAAIALIILGIYLYQRHVDHVISARFYRAFSALTAAQYKTAESGFISLAADQPGRELGQLARLYLAKCYLAQGDLRRARDSLAAYLVEARDPAFRGFALIDLGIVYEKMGDLRKAEGVYRQAAGLPPPQGTDAQLALARILTAESNRQAAVTIYRRFLQEHPFDPQRQDVIEGLARLGAPPPAEPASP